MQEGLHELQDFTEEAADGIDLVSDVMGALPEDEPKATPAPRRPSRFKRAALGASALAAGLLLATLAGLRYREGQSVQVIAPVEARLLSDSGDRTLVGKHALSRPFELEAPGGVVLLASGMELHLAPKSRLRVEADSMHLRYGKAKIQAKHEFFMTTELARIEGRGHIEISSEGGMKAKTIKGAGAIAAAVAVYLGWAKVSTSEAEMRGDAPIRMTVDPKGQIASAKLDPAVASSKGAREGLGASGAALKAEAPKATGGLDAPAGAYWSEDDQAMRFSIDGEVFDALTGRPVKDFEVRATVQKALDYGSGNVISEHYKDRADGKFRLSPLGLGAWRVTVRAHGYAPLTQTLLIKSLNDNPYLVAPLSSGARLSGQVIDPKRNPVEGAQISLDGCARKKDDLCKSTVSDSEGRFLLEGLPQGETFAIRAHHKKYGFAEQRGLRVQEGQSEHVVIQLSGVLKIFGQVLRGEPGEPLAGVTVLAGEDSRIITDEEGRYSVLVPMESRPRAVVLVKSPSGHEVEFASYPERRSSHAIEWVSAETHIAQVEKNFRLAMEKTRLFGQVTDSAGKPMAGVKLKLSNTTGWAKSRGHETFPDRTTTDQDGRYAIDNIPSEAGYRVSHRMSDGNWSMLGYVNIKKERNVEANFQLGEGSIRGRFVHREDRRPFRASSRSCARLGAERIGGGYFAHPRCYEDGRFEFPGLPPGRYLIKNRIEWMSAPIKIESKEVTLEASQVLDGVEIEVEGEESQEWKFRVTNIDGRFLGGAYIRYSQKGTVFTSSLRFGSDGVAKMRLNSMYTEVHIDASGYRSETFNLAGRDPQDVIYARLRKAE